jgi:hypothetical protein
LLLVLLATGCEDFGKLQKGFCETAKLSHPMSDAGTMVAAVCDDFETSSIDTMNWSSTTVTPGATLETLIYNELDAAVLDANDPGYAYRGHGVLHVVAPSGGSAQLVETAQTPDQPTPAIRAFVWPGLHEVASTTDLFTLVDGEGNELRKLQLVNGTPRLLDLASGMPADVPGQLTPGHWNCVNFFSRPTGMDVFLDSGIGVTLSGLTPPPQAMSTRIGAARGNDSDPASSEMWLDEVIIDSVVVGCDL